MIIPSSYPVQGVMYFIGHPQLITSILCPIIMTILWAIAATIFAFAYLLKVQAHALIRVNCPAGLAWFVCVIFVLLELALMILLFYLIILPIYQDGLFDRVLKLRGLRHVLEQNKGNGVVKCMRGVQGGLLIVFIQIIVLLLTLPLNLVPVLGQVIYAGINGWILTFGMRFHYDVEIRNYSVSQSKSEAWKRRSDFVGFGGIAVLLELIPLANLLFMWTNIVGCALWVADEIEKAERTTMAQQQEPQRQQQQQQQQQQSTLSSGGGSGGPFSPLPQSTSSLSPTLTKQDQPPIKKTGSRLSWFGRNKDQLRQRDQEPGPGQV
ncbi:CysZ protein [Entomortierella parvispora]|uniref:CysZ protein n=1 Tax=Entomortierella parvispora TaxID=205924 RepID=A0A9P3LUQ3_9FUNG|nr:CysZ protein [Entomortierella parvispora]